MVYIICSIKNCMVPLFPFPSSAHSLSSSFLYGKNIQETVNVWQFSEWEQVVMAPEGGLGSSLLSLWSTDVPLRPWWSDQTSTILLGKRISQHFWPSSLQLELETFRCSLNVRVSSFFCLTSGLDLQPEARSVGTPCCTEFGRLISSVHATPYLM